MSTVNRLPEPHPLVRFWKRIPILPRAVVGGLFVFATLQLGWNVLIVANIQMVPRIPWSAPAGLLYLWIVFRFFNGGWGSRTTSEARRQSMRARRLTWREWRSVLGACVLVFVFILSFTMLCHRLIAVPQDPDMPVVPWWTLYTTLVMISIVAGVSEEAGFRGYMQGPLEKRFGPWIAIGVTTLIFWLIHLNHPSGVARLPSLLAMGVAFGALTYIARSILPALVTHAVVDTVAFVGTASGIGPDALWSPPLLSASGVNAGFVLTLVVVVASGVLAVLTLVRLASRWKTSILAGSTHRAG